ncbi:hypothetical protein ERJ75_000676000 [Trypanosoma vivax]|nr:hypothetical protein ERJ75_000676000 [Trypanosoma vivax]
MQTVSLGVLLLLSTGVCSARGVLAQRQTKQKATVEDEKVIKRASVTVLWGWLNVTNKIGPRIGRVLEDVTSLKKNVTSLKVEADVALSSAKKVLGMVEGHSALGAVTRAIKTIMGAIRHAEECNRHAYKAESEANASNEHCSTSFGCILPAVSVTVSHHPVTACMYWEIAKRLRQLSAENDHCPGECTVSKTMSKYADDLEGDLLNLSEWKTAVKSLEETYNETIRNKGGYHWTLTSSNNEKLQNVKRAIANAA